MKNSNLGVEEIPKHVLLAIKLERSCHNLVRTHCACTDFGLECLFSVYLLVSCVPSILSQICPLCEAFKPVHISVSSMRCVLPSLQKSSHHTVIICSFVFELNWKFLEAAIFVISRYSTKPEEGPLVTQNGITSRIQKNRLRVPLVHITASQEIYEWWDSDTWVLEFFYMTSFLCMVRSVHQL